MGLFSGAFTVKSYVNIWDRNKKAVSGRLAPRGGDLGKAYRNVRGQTQGVAENATAEAGRHGLDKPGGIGGHYLNEAENIYETAMGRGRPGSSSSSSGTGDIAEPGTKATLARSRKDLYENSNKNRRIVAHTDVNKTKGKKAKQLSRIRGGR